MAETELPALVQATAAPIELAPPRYGRARRALKRIQRGFVWLYLLTAVLVALGVLLQAFSIESRLAQIEALDGRHPVQVLESDLDAADLRLPQLELGAELVEQLLDPFAENGAIDTLLVELYFRAPRSRSLELGA